VIDPRNRRVSSVASSTSIRLATTNPHKPIKALTVVYIDRKST
jgi:hypothetical protein